MCGKIYLRLKLKRKGELIMNSADDLTYDINSTLRIWREDIQYKESAKKEMLELGNVEEAVKLDLQIKAIQDCINDIEVVLW